MSSSPFSSAIARRMSATSPAVAAAIARPRQHAANDGFDLVAERRRSRNHPRPRQRHVLPGPGFAFLVVGKGIDPRRQRPGAARRPQPHVDVIEHAVIGPRRERRDQPLGEPRKILRAVQRPFAVGIGTVLVEIIEQDQVEIGGRRHLAAAEPAHREDRGLLPLDAAVLRGELIGDQAMHGVHDALGDVGKGDAGLLGGNRAGQNSRADQEQALLAEQPQAIEEILVGTPRPSAWSPAARTIPSGPASRRRNADRSGRP